MYSIYNSDILCNSLPYSFALRYPRTSRRYRDVFCFYYYYIIIYICWKITSLGMVQKVSHLLF